MIIYVQKKNSFLKSRILGQRERTEKKFPEKKKIFFAIFSISSCFFAHLKCEWNDYRCCETRRFCKFDEFVKRIKWGQWNWKKVCHLKLIWQHPCAMSTFYRGGDVICDLGQGISQWFEAVKVLKWGKGFYMKFKRAQRFKGSFDSF